MSNKICTLGVCDYIFFLSHCTDVKSASIILLEYAIVMALLWVCIRIWICFFKEIKESLGSSS